MEGISDAHRRVLALHFFDDLESAEASAVLGCSRRTFAVKLHRAINALREAMAAQARDVLEVSDVA
jgi:DNA-directed RNA polymerase specialized sigma24 family protein